MEEGARFLSGTSCLGHLDEQSWQEFGAKTYCPAPNSVLFSGTGPSSTHPYIHYNQPVHSRNLLYTRQVGRLVSKPAIGASFPLRGELVAYSYPWLLPPLSHRLSRLSGESSLFSPQKKKWKSCEGSREKGYPKLSLSLRHSTPTHPPFLTRPAPNKTRASWLGRNNAAQGGNGNVGSFTKINQGLTVWLEGRGGMGVHGGRRKKRRLRSHQATFCAQYPPPTLVLCAPTLHIPTPVRRKPWSCLVDKPSLRRGLGRG